MSIRPTPLALNEYYHIYSRGVDKRPIFLEQGDKERFIRLLYICNSSTPIVYREVRNLPLSLVKTGEKITAIGAYCLMPNHFHLLLRETEEGGITKFMRKFLTAYSSYFNLKYERNGILFSSRFKSSHLDSDEYLKHIFSYIHLNPIKIFKSDWDNRSLDRLVAENTLKKYKESSYFDYASDNDRPESLILNKLAFPEYFLTKEKFRDNIFDWFDDSRYSIELTKDGPM